MTDRYIAVSGCSLRYRDTGGPGVPIILSHGIGGSLDLWAPQLTDMGSTHRVIAWDAPNHGLSGLSGKTEDFDSYAVWLLAFADALGLDQFIAVGNSMGGAMSLRVAALAPNRVKGVVLANAASLGREVFPPFKLMTLPWLGELITKPSKKGLDRQIDVMVRDPACLSADLRATMLRNLFKQGGARAFLASLRTSTDLGGQSKTVFARSHALLRELDVPMLILHGRQDAILPLKHSEAAAKMARNSQLLVLEDCGHTPQLEKPAEFNAALVGFVGRVG